MVVAQAAGAYALSCPKDRIGLLSAARSGLSAVRPISTIDRWKRAQNRKWAVACISGGSAQLYLLAVDTKFQCNGNVAAGGISVSLESQRLLILILRADWYFRLGALGTRM